MSTNAMFKNDKVLVLVALYIFGVMIAELMGGKTFQLLHFSWLHLNASVAIFVMPLLFTATDVITEVYGREQGRKLVRLGLLTIIVLLPTALLFTSLPPSARFAPQEAGYDNVFGTSIRFAIASLAAFAASEFLDVTVYAKLKQRLSKYGLWFRNNASNIVSQFVDSAVFLIIAFYSFGEAFGANIGFIVGLLIPYWLIRCACSLLETPLVYIGVKWLRSGDASEPTVPVSAQASSKRRSPV